MADFNQQDQRVDTQINIAGDINNSFASQRDEYFRTALNWDKKTSLREFDLSNRNLSGINFKGCDLSGANLENANLSNANLQGADLSNTKLKGANLHNTKLKSTNLEKADLKDTNVTDKQLSIAKHLRWARMPDSKLYNGKFLLSGDIDNWAKKYGLSARFFPLSENSRKRAKETAFVFFANKVKSTYEERDETNKSGRIVTTYQLSMDDFMEGQRWAEKNVAQPRQRRRQTKGILYGAVGVVIAFVIIGIVALTIQNLIGVAGIAQNQEGETNTIGEVVASQVQEKSTIIVSVSENGCAANVQIVDDVGLVILSLYAVPGTSQTLQLPAGNYQVNVQYEECNAGSGGLGGVAGVAGASGITSTTFPIQVSAGSDNVISLPHRNNNILGPVLLILLLLIYFGFYTPPMLSRLFR